MTFTSWSLLYLALALLRRGCGPIFILVMAYGTSRRVAVRCFPLQWWMDGGRVRGGRGSGGLRPSVGSGLFVTAVPQSGMLHPDLLKTH